MEEKFRYNTVTSAINALRQNGFTHDFNLFEDHVAYGKLKFAPADLAIKVLYRYEGNSDPADEATVYGLESKNGLKGILVFGDETNPDAGTAEFLKELHLNNNN